MKRVIILLLVLLLVIFVLNIQSSYKSFDSLQQTQALIINDSNILRFEPNGTLNSAATDLGKRISDTLESNKSSIKKLSTWGIILNFLITIITGISALLSAISTIKNSTLSKSVAIQIAVITFISSLSSYGLSQINSFKEENVNKRAKVLEIREELESLRPNEVIEALPRLNKKLDEVLL